MTGYQHNLVIVFFIHKGRTSFHFNLSFSHPNMMQINRRSQSLSAETVFYFHIKTEEMYTILTFSIFNLKELPHFTVKNNCTSGWRE